MNKKILSLAVAAAMAAPLAAQADVTVYGQIQMSVDNIDSHTANDYFTWPVGSIWSSPSSNCGFFGAFGSPAGFPCVSIPAALDGGFGPFGVFRWGRSNAAATVDNWQLRSNNSRLGFKGSEDLGNGLSAIWGIELSVDVAGDRSLGGGDDIGTRNMFLGLSSPWGTVLGGKHDHPYKVMFGSWDKFQETPADDDQVMTGAASLTIPEFRGQDQNGFADRRASNALAYISPTLGGVTFAGATILAELNSDDGVFTDTAGYSLAASGSWGPIKGALGYEVLNDLNLNHNMFPFWADDNLRDDDSLWAAAVAFDSAPFYVGLRYEDRSGVAYIKDYDIQQWRLTATYSFGNNTVKAMYHWLEGSTPSYNFGGDYEGDAWAVGIDHNFSKRTMLYALYVKTDWSIDGNTGLGRFNGQPFVGGTGPGSIVMSALPYTTFGQPTLMDTEVFSLGMLHKF